MTTKEQATHSPLPWSTQARYRGRSARRRPFKEVVVAPDGVVAKCIVGVSDRSEANADLIVRAVNSHHDLLAALKEAGNQLTYYIDGGDFRMADDTSQQLAATRDDIRAAISKAEGQA